MLDTLTRIHLIAVNKFENFIRLRQEIVGEVLSAHNTQLDAVQADNRYTASFALALALP